MDILQLQKSVLGLCKNNNGFFKSEKQATFLIKEIDSNYGFVGYTSSGFHSCKLFCEYDEKGIIKITKESNTKKGVNHIVTFQRAVNGQLNPLQVKHLKQLKKQLAFYENQLNTRIELNKTNPLDWRTESIEQDKERVNNFQKAIQDLENCI